MAEPTYEFVKGVGWVPGGTRKTWYCLDRYKLLVKVTECDELPPVGKPYFSFPKNPPRYSHWAGDPDVTIPDHVSRFDFKTWNPWTNTIYPYLDNRYFMLESVNG